MEKEFILKRCQDWKELLNGRIESRIHNGFNNYEIDLVGGSPTLYIHLLGKFDGVCKFNKTCKLNRNKKFDKFNTATTNPLDELPQWVMDNLLNNGKLNKIYIDAGIEYRYEHCQVRTKGERGKITFEGNFLRKMPGDFEEYASF